MSRPARVLLFVTLSWFVTNSAFADQAADRAAIESAAQSWSRALNARDVERMLTLTTDDIVLLDAQRAPSIGHASAREAWQNAMKRTDVQLSNITKEITVVSDVAWRVATWTLAGSRTQSTSALEVWRRVGAEWKLHRQMSVGLLSREALVRPLPSEPRLDSQRN